MNKVICRPYSYSTVLDDATGYSYVHCWALTASPENRPVLVRIKDCLSYVVAVLPKRLNNAPKIWSNSDGEEIVRTLRNRMGERGPINFTIQQKQPINMFQGSRLTTIILLAFKCQEHVKHCSNLLNYELYTSMGKLTLNVVESNIPLHLRFLVDRNLSYTDRIECTGKIVHKDRFTKPGTSNVLEILTTEENVVKHTATEFNSFPGILSFDIETYSPVHRSMPNVLEAKHVCYLISVIFQREGDVSSRKREVIVIGECNDRIEDYVINKVSNEKELILKFCDLINKYDPEIIMGYNNFGYDIPYLVKRLSMFYMTDWPVIGRAEGLASTVYSREWYSAAYGHNSIYFLEMEGRINMDMLPIIKRDHKLEKYTLGFVSKKFINKTKNDVTPSEMFLTYELNRLISKPLRKNKIQIKKNLGETILKNRSILNKNLIGECLIKNLTDKEILQLGEIATSRLDTVIKYCVQDSELVLDLFQKLNTWISLVELSGVVDVNILEIFINGQQKRCLHQIFRIASRTGTYINKVQTELYNVEGGLVGVPSLGFHTWAFSLDFKSLYPSVIQENNICYTTLVHPDDYSSVDMSKCHVIEFTQQENPDSKNNKGEDDFKTSLYQEDVSSFDNTGDDKEPVKTKTITRRYKAVFVKKEIRVGILPTLVKELVDGRNKVRAVQKELVKEQNSLKALLKDAKNRKEIEENIKALEFKYTVLECRQLALKVSANSAYGFMGVPKGLLPLLMGSMAVTATGRDHTRKVNDLVVNKYKGEILYNDTDSIMPKFDLPDQEALKQVDKIVTEINGVKKDGKVIIPPMFSDDVLIEFENIRDIVFLAKKKYAYLLRTRDGGYVKDSNGEVVIVYKGLLPARRDNCALVRNLYTKIVKNILTGVTVNQCFNDIVDAISAMFLGEYSIRENFVISNAMGENYVSENFFMALFGNELSRIGQPAKPSERIEYVIVKTEEEVNGEEDVKFGNKLREISIWEDCWRAVHTKDSLIVPVERPHIPTLSEEVQKKIGFNVKKEAYPYLPEKIDYLYYLERKFQNAIDQLFSVGYSKQLVGDIPAYNYVAPEFSRRGTVLSSEPIKMLVACIKDLNARFELDDKMIGLSIAAYKDIFISMKK